MTRIKDIESKRLGDGDASQNRRGKSEVTIKRDDIGCSCGRCKRRRLARMFFPQELVFNILLRLPAQIIYDVMRHVCREWKDMIHTRGFIYNHLMHSPTGLLIYCIDLPYPIFISMGPGDTGISMVGYTFPGLVQSSCNGLVLVSDMNFIYVANPITKKQITLPPFFSPFFCFHKSRIAYAVDSMEYKVVLTYPCDGKMNFCCAVLTIGVGPIWRHIDTSHLCVRTRRAFQQSPLVTGGFVNWIAENFVLSLNVETETINQSHIPFSSSTRNCVFLAMGSKISWLAFCNEFLLDVWEMKPETGEWTKLFDIDLEAQRCKLERFYCTHEYCLWPIGWLKSGEVLFFRVSYPSTLSIAYNVKTQEIHSVDLGSNEGRGAYAIHVNSLVWFGY